MQSPVHRARQREGALVGKHLRQHWPEGEAADESLHGTTGDPTGAEPLGEPRGTHATTAVASGRSRQTLPRRLRLALIRRTGWIRPRRIAVIVALVALVAGSVTAAVAVQRHFGDEVERTSAGQQDGRAPGVRPGVVMVGDASTLGSDRRATWPGQVGDRLDLAIENDVGAGAGYVQPASSDTFLEIARRVPPGTDVVVFVGGAGPDESSSTLAREAARVVSAARTSAANATVVVVAGVPGDGSTSAERSAMRTAVERAGGRWVDASGWFRDRGLVSAGRLTASGIARFGDRITSLVRSAIG